MTRMTGLLVFVLAWSVAAQGPAVTQKDAAQKLAGFEVVHGSAPRHAFASNRHHAPRLYLV